MFDVLCTGLTCCDLIFTHLEKFPELGKEVCGKDFYIKAGGAANTPMALAKLGLKTVFATEIGTDEPGKIIYRYMRDTGLDMSAVLFDDSFRTNVSAVLSCGYERGFASYFAKCEYGTLEKKIEQYMPSCTHIHTYIEDCLHMPVVEMAERLGKPVSVDMGWDERITIADIKHVLRKCSVFMANELEACSIAQTDSALEALELLGEYARLVVIKCGSKGSIVKQGKRIITVPGIKGIEVLDTTGAGDLYGAGFIYGTLKGWDIERTANFASASGGIAVTFYGGMDSAYTLEGVTDYYNLLQAQKEP